MQRNSITSSFGDGSGVSAVFETSCFLTKIIWDKYGRHLFHHGSENMDASIVLITFNSWHTLGLSRRDSPCRAGPHPAVWASYLICCWTVGRSSRRTRHDTGCHQSFWVGLWMIISGWRHISRLPALGSSYPKMLSISQVRTWQGRRQICRWCESRIHERPPTWRKISRALVLRSQDGVPDVIISTSGNKKLESMKHNYRLQRQYFIELKTNNYL